MFIISKPNCSGKTRELINYALENDFPIFCTDEVKEELLKRKSVGYFGVVCKTVTPNSIDTISENSKVLVDNADEFFNNLFHEKYHRNLAGVTFNND